LIPDGSTRYIYIAELQKQYLNSTPDGSTRLILLNSKTVPKSTLRGQQELYTVALKQ
jgi:hypothetical protein